MTDNGLGVEQVNGVCRLHGPDAAVAAFNDYLAYLADRNYSPRTVRAYAFDLLAFARWLEEEGLLLDGVTTEALLGFLGSCRTAVLAGQRGGNVYSIRDGRNAGYAPSTINRRLAALSGLFAFRSMRDPAATNPVPRRRDAGIASPGRPGGLLAHLAKPRARSRLRVREPRRLPRGVDRTEAVALLASFLTWRDRSIAGLMLLSGLRSAEVLGLDVGDVDIARRWVRVTGKGAKERRVPIDFDVATAVQTYLLAERPETASSALFVVAKGPNRGQRLSAAGLRTVFRYHRGRAGVPAGHPHALRHSFFTGFNAGVSLQSLMALLGHVSAEMSLRYGRLFDATVRAEYERALVLAKQQLGPVMPTATPVSLSTDWRQAPAIKARLAGGFCVRAEAQGPCAYANICEHCPNLRTDATYLPVLASQRVDAEALAADAQVRGWIAEAERHRRLIERIDLLMGQARAG